MFLADCGALLKFEQRLFAFDTPTVASHVAVAAQHAMARNEQRDAVTRTSAGDGTGCAGQAKFRRSL